MIVIGAGTGGTVCGIGRKVKEVLPSCKVRIFVCMYIFVTLYGTAQRQHCTRSFCVLLESLLLNALLLTRSHTKSKVETKVKA